MQEFAIVGPTESGKTTFGRYFAEFLGTEATDTSAVLVEVETKRQKVLCDRYRLETFLESPDDDSRIVTQWDWDRGRPQRELLVAMGDAFVECLGMDFLAQRCLDRGRVVVGVRRRLELETLKAKRRALTTVWIERPGTQGATEDNLDIGAVDCDRILLNDGSLEDLRQLAKSLAEELGSC